MTKLAHLAHPLTVSLWSDFLLQRNKGRKDSITLKGQKALSLNTQYMRKSTIVYLLKMEYVSKINIFGLKMMVKSVLEKMFLKFLHAYAILGKMIFTS